MVCEASRGKLEDGSTVVLVALPRVVTPALEIPDRAGDVVTAHGVASSGNDTLISS